MTQVSLPRPNVVIYGESNGVDTKEINEYQGFSGGHLDSKMAKFSDAAAETTGSQNPTKLQSSRSKAEKIQEGLERTISVDAKHKIEKILSEANELSDVEKLLLYLKLPTGSALGYSKDGSSSVLQSSNRLEQIEAVTWIKSHLEEHAETSLPKQEVYDDYRLYCESHCYKSLSQGDFGKVMKVVFPNVKPRRLGQRGQSKHCYGGLRKKVAVRPPTLPDVVVQPQPHEPPEEKDGVVDEVLVASCQVVCEWAQKLLTQKFDSIKELAECLVSSQYVISSSMAAFTILAAMQKVDLPKTSTTTTPSTPSSGGNLTNRHRETQLQLQRKLHERELIREQKRKMELQHAEILTEEVDQGDGSNSNGLLRTPNSTPMKTTKIEKTKSQTPLTPQKLILPKTMSSSHSGTTSITHTTHTQIAGKAIAQTTMAAVQNGGSTQPILVISPTPHTPHLSHQTNQVVQQPVFILSPLHQGAAPHATAIRHSVPQQVLPHGSTLPAKPATAQTLVTQPPPPPQPPPHLQQSGAIVPVQLLNTMQPQQSPVTATTTTVAALPKGVSMVQIPILQSQQPQQPISVSGVVAVTNSQRQMIPNRPGPGTHPQLPPRRPPPPPPPPPNMTVPDLLSQHKLHNKQQQHIPPKQSTQHKDTIANLLSNKDSGHNICTNASSHTPTSSFVPITSTNTITTSRKSRTASTPSRTPAASKSNNSGVIEISPITERGCGVPADIVNATLHTADQDSASAIGEDNDNNVPLSRAASVPVTGNSSALLSPPAGSTAPLTPGGTANSPLSADKAVKSGGKGRGACSKPMPNPRTVSSMLKEQRGYGLLIDSKNPYNNDRRPVSELLRESRERGTKTVVTGLLGSSSDCISPQTTLMTPPTVSPGLSPQMTPTLSPTTVMMQTISVSNSSTSAIATSSVSMSDTPESTPTVATSTLSAAALGLINSSNPDHKSHVQHQHMNQNHSRSKPSNKNLKNTNRRLSLSGNNLLKRELASATEISAVPPNKKAHLTDACASPAAQVALARQKAGQKSGLNNNVPRSKGSEMNINTLEKDALLDYLDNEPVPDLADITPSITPFQFVNSQDVETLTDSDSNMDLQQPLSVGSTHQSIQEPHSLPGSLPGSRPGSSLQQPYPTNMNCIMNEGSGLMEGAVSSASDFCSPPAVRRVVQSVISGYETPEGLRTGTPTGVNGMMSEDGARNLDQMLKSDIMLSQAGPHPVTPRLIPMHSSQQSSQGVSTVTNSVSTSGMSNPRIRSLLRSTSVGQGSQVTEGSTSSYTGLTVGQPQTTEGMPMSNVLTQMARRAQSRVPGHSSIQQAAQGVPANISATQSPACLVSPGSMGTGHQSANSTPMTSPIPTQQDGRNSSLGPRPVEFDQSAAFMPIQNTNQDDSTDVSLVRPQVTVANMQNMGTSQPMLLQDVRNNGGGFIPYTGSMQMSTTGGATIVAQQQGPGQQQLTQQKLVLQAIRTNPQLISNPTIRERLAQKLGLSINQSLATSKIITTTTNTTTSKVSKAPGQFAPASSIKPVKRGQKGGKGSKTRQRHHSAQSALGGAAISQSGVPFPLQTGVNSSLQMLLQNRRASQPEVVNTQPPPLEYVPNTDANNMSLGPSTPESPFSPEMQDIFGGNGGVGATGLQGVTVQQQQQQQQQQQHQQQQQQQQQQQVAQQGNVLFRSHSVPVQDMLYCGSDNQDLFNASTESMLEQRKDNNDLFDNSLNVNISSLLQDKLQNETTLAGRGMHVPGNDTVGARRNITQMLEIEGKQLANQDTGLDFDDQSHSGLLKFTRKGDMTLTSASLYDPRSSSIKGMPIRHNNPVPTPPSSQNTSPDFSHELQGITSSNHGLVNHMNSVGMVSTPSLDTPSSLDNLSAQDSRESLNETLFQGICDANSDMAQDLSSGQSLDMMGSSDFNFTQWDMPQMVHD